MKRFLSRAFMVLVLVAIVTIIVSPWGLTRIQYAALVLSGEHQETMEEAVRLYLQDSGDRVEEAKYRRLGVVWARYRVPAEVSETGEEKHLQARFQAWPVRIAIHNLGSPSEHFVRETAVEVPGQGAWYVQIYDFMGRPVKPE